MNISEVDLKKLWGKAAGRCSYPGCPTNCIEFFEKSGDSVLGEMAHVIPQGKAGPRATGTKGPDTYENLILLCPTHHTTVDKAPNDFPAELLHRWKTDHEENIRKSLEGAAFSDFGALCLNVEKILLENFTIHSRFGPESQAAKSNPLSEGSKLWTLRKCSTILPNNTKITDIFERNRDKISASDWKTFLDFREHAIAFQKNTYDRMECDIVPRFPKAFQQMIEKNAK